LFIASSAEPKDRHADLLSRAPVVFTRPGSTLTTHDPIVKKAMIHLRNVWPKRESFPELLSAARNAVFPGVVARDVREVEREARELAHTMIRCYATSHVDLHFESSRATTTVSATPTASTLVRRQAKDGVHVTNLWHHSVRIGDLERHLLRYLDGRHAFDALIDVLEGEVSAKRLVLHDQGREFEDPGKIRASLHNILRENLTSLARKGILLDA